MSEQTQQNGKALEHVAQNLEKNILTTINISKDLEVELSRVGELLQRVGRETTEEDSEPDQFAKVLIHGRERIDTVESATRDLALTTQKVADSIQKLAEDAKSIARAFQDLKRVSHEIARFVSKIQDIADQTKMLSLNARLEAARAGEHGRGFTVVADEVKELSAAARQNSDRVNQIIDKFTSSIDRFEQELKNQLNVLNAGNQKLENASKLADRALTEIQGLNDSVAHIEDILSSLEHLTDIDQGLNEAQISSQNLRKHAEQALHYLGKAFSHTLHGRKNGVGTIEEELYKAITAEQYHRSLQIVQEALNRGTPGSELLMLISNLCERIMYEQKQRRLTLSEIYINGRIIEGILDLVLPTAEEEIHTSFYRGTVVLANAFGDYHSLGRKMVAVFLRASGYRVIDLGVSVPNEKIIEVALDQQARLIGISALLLHTAGEVTKLRKALDHKQLSDIKIVVGGAPFMIDGKLNDRIGADFVARSAAEGVDIANFVFTGEA